MKLVNIKEENLCYLLNDLSNPGEIFRNDLTCENITSHKKAGIPLLSPRQSAP